MGLLNYFKPQKKDEKSEGGQPPLQVVEQHELRRSTAGSVTPSSRMASDDGRGVYFLTF